MTDFCSNKKANDTYDPDRVNEPSAGDNQYRDEVVMESGGTIESDTEGYVESDDEMNAIAEGWK